MSERAKIVTLVILVVVLVAVGFYQLVIRKPRTPAKTATGPAVTADEATVEKTELPSKNELNELSVWLDAPPIEDASHPVAGRFGLLPVDETAGSGSSVVEVTVPGETPRFPPPLLGGIMAVEGELKAIIGGRTYARGDAIPGSDYRITDITLTTVIFEDSNGRVAKATLLQ